MSANKPCRHRHSWLICNGHAEWCYECGAYRGLKVTGINTCEPRTTWVRPVGQGGENPWDKMRNLKPEADA